MAENQELTTVDIEGVEILKAGKFQAGDGMGNPVDLEVTQNDLLELAAAHADTADSVKVPIRLGHADDQRSLWSDGLPSAGWVQNLRVKADRLIADFRQVPKRIADFIKAGSFGPRSSGIDFDFRVGEVTYPQLLTHVALLGADLPAVDGLNDLAALFSRPQARAFSDGEREGNELIWSPVNTTNAATPTRAVLHQVTEEEPGMDLAPIRERLGVDKDEDILSAIEALQGDAAVVAEVDAENRDAAVELAAVTETVLELRSELERRDIEGVVDGAIDAGRVAPSGRADALRLARALHKAEGLEFTKAHFSSMSQVVPVGDPQGESGNESAKAADFAPTEAQIAVFSAKNGGAKPTAADRVTLAKRNATRAGLDEAEVSALFS